LLLDPDNRGGKPVTQTEFREAILKASRLNRVDNVRELVERGAELNAIDDYGATILHAQFRDVPYLPVVRELLRLGANVDARAGNGKTALMMAVEQVRPDIVQELIARGASVNIADEDGKTAVMYAAMTGRLDCIPILVAGGADLSLRDRRGESAMDLVEGRNADRVRKLLLALIAGEESEYRDTEVIISRDPAPEF
jgi:ankyrin repeat protein